ncbi:MAG: alpha/beta hydrolase [Acidobacteriota bacterium]|nr:alpha/beta hydrolase [Acidobacteriota bacterium]
MVLVGHSYGVMVIAGVAEKAAERLAHLVYLDVVVPEDGKSLIDFQPPEVLAIFHEKARTEGDGYKLPSFPAEVFSVTNKDDLAWVKSRLNPHPFKTKLDAVRLTNPKAAEIPRACIYCNNPAVGPFRQFAEGLRYDESWQYVELATGHDAMITEPKKLADLLLEIAVTSFCATTCAVRK